MAGDGEERHVAVCEMDADAVEIVRPEGAMRAAGLPVGTEHEVVDDELTSTIEQIGQRPSSTRRFEFVRLLHALPGKLAALPADLVAQPRELLLFGEERG